MGRELKLGVVQLDMSLMCLYQDHFDPALVELAFLTVIVMRIPDPDPVRRRIGNDNLVTEFQALAD